MSKILFIDDDKAAIRYYLEELQEEGFEVKHCRRPDDALSCLEEGRVFDLIIVDSAMPPGRRYGEADTEEGLTTGALLFNDIRSLQPTVPILILTNFSRLPWIEKACTHKNVRQSAKLEINPTQLATLVADMIKGAQS